MLQVPCRPTIALLLFIISLLNVLYLSQHPFRVRGSAPSHIYQYTAHDFPMTLPLTSDLEFVTMQVEESTHFPLLGDLSDPQWRGITSAGWGYLRLGPDRRIFMVTMFHELHCLRVLNFAFANSSMAPQEHVHHCLGYLRQMALCAADTTLEPGDFVMRDFEVERTGATHTCRDWSAVYDTMQSHWDEWAVGTGMAM